MADKRYTKMSLIERCALTFESFLRREFGGRFYQPEFLEGISARRLEVAARQRKATRNTILLATLLAFFDLIAGSSISYGGLTLQISTDLQPVIAVLTASALLNMVFTMIDELIIFRILIKLGNNIHIHNFPLLLVDKMAHNLWSDALFPRVSGQRSGRGQSIAVVFLGTILVVLSLILYTYPAFMICRVFLDVVSSDTRWIAKAIASVALAILAWATLLGLTFIVRFKFYPADWHESTNQPTEEFVQRMQAEIAKGGGDGSNKTEA